MADLGSAETEKKERDKPLDIKFDSVVVDIDFHPKKDVIASGLIDGEVTLHSYSLTEDSHKLLSFSHHKKSCRALRFSPSGDWLGTVSKDKSLRIVDMEHGSIKYALKKAHDAAIYSLLPINEAIVTTADEDGRLKVWDLRLQSAVMDLKENDDFISDMLVDDDNRVLVASSGDGTLTAFDIRKHKMKLQSELFDSELLSLARVKRGRKMVCGSGEGVLNIFNWGEWGNISDRFPGHPMSVDCMVAITDDVVCTGSMDGIIRAVHVLPNRIIGEVGEHDEFPVENLALSRCRSYLASCSHDETIKFWNVSELPNEKINARSKSKACAAKKKLGTSSANTDFFSDFMPESNEDKDHDDSDSDDDDDDGEDGSDDSVKEADSDSKKDEHSEEEEDGDDDENDDVDSDDGEEEEDDEIVETKL